MKTVVLLILLCVGATAQGCGGSEVPAAEIPKLGRECRLAGEAEAGTMHLCYRPGTRDAGRFVVVSGSGQQQALAVKPPPGIGHWRWAAVSPDGATILAEWSAECEIPLAFLVPASGGRPRPAFASDAASRAFGWTVDGRAIVALLSQTPCSGRNRKPGLYLIAPGDGSTRVDGLRSSPKRSLRPRALEKLEPDRG